MMRLIGILLSARSEFTTDSHGNFPDEFGVLICWRYCSAIFGRHLINRNINRLIAEINIIVGSRVVDRLSSRKTLTTFEQLITINETTGVVKKSKTASLGRTLGASFLLFSRLKAEKMDLVISRGLGASLELILIEAKSGKIVWGGAGEWKRGGMFGAGKATPEQAAENLVNLAFSSL